MTLLDDWLKAESGSLNNERTQPGLARLLGYKDLSPQEHRPQLEFRYCYKLMLATKVIEPIAKQTRHPSCSRRCIWTSLRPHLDRLSEPDRSKAARRKEVTSIEGTPLKLHAGWSYIVNDSRLFA